jgi:AcrR family transcriptional regulator
MEDYRGRIQAAATRLFAQNGIARTTMAEIAAEAGLDEEALHVYYPDKTSLYYDLASEQTNEFVSAMVMASEHHTEPGPYLREILSIVHSILMNNPEFLRITLHAILEKREIFFRTMESPVFPHEVFDKLQHFVDEGKLKPIHPVHLALMMDALTLFTQVLREQLAHADMSEPEKESFLHAWEESLMMLLESGLIPREQS